MPLLIDGNNLMFALKEFGLDVGRSGFCRLLSAMVQRSHDRDRTVCVVFDGAAPHGPLMRQIEAPGIQLRFSGRLKADELILGAIADSTAPRRLTVVSTDRQIRAAARRRRCPGLTSLDFAQQLLAALDRPVPRPSEPPEKRAGSTAQQTQEWLREFGIQE